MDKEDNANIDFRTYEGFEELYERTADQLFIIIFRQTGDKAVTQELVQNIYMKLWERRFEIKLDLSIAHYLNRAAKLSAMDYLKTFYRRKHHLEQMLMDHSTADYDTEKVVLFQDLKTQILMATDRLPPKCKEVFLLSREQGLNIQQISTKLSIAEKTVESHLTKALKIIKKSDRYKKIKKLKDD